DAHVGAAAALETGERLLDLRVGRLLVLIEERGRRHDPAVDAVAALRHLLLDIGLLDGVRLLRRAEAGEGDDLAAADRRHRGHAGAHGLAVDVHRAGAALRQTAAEMRVVERELVAQRIEQGHVGIGVDRFDLAVHVEVHSGHGRISPLGWRENRPARTDLGNARHRQPIRRVPSLAVANGSRVEKLVQRAGLGNTPARALPRDGSTPRVHWLCRSAYGRPPGAAKSWATSASRAIALAMSALPPSASPVLIFAIPRPKSGSAHSGSSRNAAS